MDAANRSHPRGSPISHRGLRYAGKVGLCFLCLAGAGCQPPPVADGPPPPEVVFTDITARAGLARTSQPCIAIRDFDGDGRPDILMAPSDENGRYSGQLAFYRNLGEARFEMHAVPLPISGTAACAVGDVDNDGLPDVVIGVKSPVSVILLRHGRGADPFAFAPPASLFSLPPEAMAVSALSLVDLDNDGRLDIVVGTYASAPGDSIDHCDVGPRGEVRCYPRKPLEAAPSILLHNDGGSFSRSPIVLPTRLVNSISAVDWDRDGWTDLFFSNDFGSNNLLHNDGGTGFTDLLPASGGDAYNHGMGAAIADFDGDGLLDIYNTELGADQLFFGRRDGRMDDGAEALDVSTKTRFHLGWSPMAADFNNDGVVDLFVANNSDEQDGDEKALERLDQRRRSRASDYLFIGRGGRAHAKFERTAPHPSAVIDTLATARGDIDGDGYVDLLEAGAFTPTILLRNDSSNDSGHWLDVHLTGTTSNRDAVGAMIEIVDGSAHPLGQRGVGAGGLGASHLVVHFGLGSRTSIDGLIVHWPGGKTQRVEGPLAVDRAVNVVEE